MEYHYAAQYMFSALFLKKAYIMQWEIFVTFINYRFNSVSDLQLSWT